MKLFCREKRLCSDLQKPASHRHREAASHPPPQVTVSQRKAGEERLKQKVTASQSKQQSATRKSFKSKACHCKQLLMQQIRDTPSTGRDREVLRSSYLLPGGTGGHPLPGLQH